MKWSDVKLATLQKMFSSNGLNVNIDSSTQEYIYAMPQACNEALQMLATAGKFIVKNVEIVNRPLDNLLGDSFRNYMILNDSLTFSAVAKAYYFEAQGQMEVDINGTVIAVDSNGYTPYRGLIDNPDDDEIAITFTSQFPANVKNVCLYACSFADDDHVPAYGRFMRYYMKDLAADFYQFQASELYKDDESGYEVADECYQEAERVFVIPRKKEGVFRVYYKAYPEIITHDTEDDYDLPLDPEVATLLPLYMASQLYKDDDNSIATVYRNEFEVAFDRLSNGTMMQRKEEFVSETGWV